MFLTEAELREIFWKNYNYSGRALRYQFECPIREGCADLITVEPGGKWKMIYKPTFQSEVRLSQPILKMMINEI